MPRVAIQHAGQQGGRAALVVPALAVPVRAGRNEALLQRPGVERFVAEHSISRAC